jgi:hypothetical protein
MQFILRPVKIFLIICAIALLLLGLFVFDVSATIPKQSIFTLVDKWHEENCSPIYGGNGSYMGESCSDDWRFVVIEDGKREEVRVSGSLFKTFVVGDRLKRKFDQGKLGFHHNEEWSKIS